MSVLEILRARGRKPAGKLVETPEPKPASGAESLCQILGGKVIQPAEPVTPQAVATLVISYPDSYPSPSVRISEGVIIADIEKFVAKTVAVLRDYIAAINAGRRSWLARTYLVEEWIRKLALCGVIAEIYGADNTEPELKPLKLDSSFRVRYQSGTGIDDPDAEKHYERPKRGLTDAEVRKLFATLELDPDDRTGLPENISSWLRRCDAIQARTKAMRENPDYCRQLARECPTPTAAVELRTPSDREFGAIRSKQGKRGAVICRKCYRAMELAAVNGGYDWFCAACAIVWRYRYNTTDAT